MLFNQDMEVKVNFNMLEIKLMVKVKVDSQLSLNILEIKVEFLNNVREQEVDDCNFMFMGLYIIVECFNNYEQAIKSSIMQ